MSRAARRVSGIINGLALARERRDVDRPEQLARSRIEDGGCGAHQLGQRVGEVLATGHQRGLPLRERRPDAVGAGHLLGVHETGRQQDRVETCRQGSITHLPVDDPTRGIGEHEGERLVADVRDELVDHRAGRPTEQAVSVEGIVRRDQHVIGAQAELQRTPPRLHDLVPGGGDLRPTRHQSHQRPAELPFGRRHPSDVASRLPKLERPMPGRPARNYSNGGCGESPRSCGYSVVRRRHPDVRSDRRREAMEIVPLGGTDLKVSRVAFGAWELGGEWGAVRPDAAIDAIRSARRLGINLFDTAQGYGFGASERLVAAALRDDLDHARAEVVIATKGGLRLTPDGLVRDSTPAWLRRGVDESLVALGVDHIDLYQVHWPDPAVPFEETAGALHELVDLGKIRHVGVSNFDIDQIVAFGGTWPVETLQAPYHLFRQDAGLELLPFCSRHDIGVLTYGTLAHGLLTGMVRADTTFAEHDWRRASPLFRGESFVRNREVVPGPPVSCGRARGDGQPARHRLGARQPVGRHRHRRYEERRSRRRERRWRRPDPLGRRSGPDRRGHATSRAGGRTVAGGHAMTALPPDQPAGPVPPTVAMLGLGTMGHAMAVNSLRAGVPTIVWSRSPEQAHDLRVLGARVARTVRDAAQRADIVVTMVTDLNAVLDVAVGQGMLDAMAPGAIWLQMSTIGLGIDRVAQIVAERRPDVSLVDAPVSGSKGPAEAGTLTIFASGPDEAVTRAAPYLDAIGGRTVRVGPAGWGSRVKLVNNTMLALTAEGVAATVSLAHRLGIPDETLLDALDGSPLVSPWSGAKLRRMSHDDYSAEFALALALKDVDLALDTLDTETFAALRALAEEWHQAVADGLGGDDVTVVARVLDDRASHAPA